MTSIPRKLLRIYIDAADFFFPRRCTVCGKILARGEENICVSCYMKLPFTRWKGKSGNAMERLFWAQFPICRANALLGYHGGDDSRKIVLALKYRNRQQIGEHFGRIMAADLIDTTFFEGIDAIVPIPLSKKRQLQRGYNQSESLAEGVSKVTGIPVLNNIVERIKDNPTQTKLNTPQRKQNVEGIFRTIDKDSIRGKHILLIDDVLTTGATILSCAQELSKDTDVRISILTLFVAGNHGSGPIDIAE